MISRLRQGRVAVPAAAVFALTAVLLGGCATTHVSVDIDAAASGRGYVSVEVSVPASTAAQIPDLASGLPVADLRAAGWRVATPVRERGGAVGLFARHSFVTLAQVSGLMSQIVGSGPVGGRPFQVYVAESSSALGKDYKAEVRVDLRCGLGCFADPGLQRSVGYALGLPQSQLRRVVGPHPLKDMTFSLAVTLPGKPAGAAGAGSGSVSRSWAVPLGSAVARQLHTQVVDVAAIRRIVAAVAAGALLVLLSAGALVARHRRDRRRRRRVQFGGHPLHRARRRRPGRTTAGGWR